MVKRYGPTMAIRAHFRKQAGACAELGSPLTAAVLELLAERLDTNTRVGRAVLGWPGDPRADALALRLAGGLHALVLEGHTADLAAAYGNDAPGDGIRREALWSAVAAALDSHADHLLWFLERPPQTNEVARAAVLLGGFHTIATATGRPLRLLEIGASAGLNLQWDAYRYCLGGTTLGPADAAVCLAPEWRGPLPPPGPVAVASRRGCDQAPIDPASASDRLRLRAYIWADQTERRRRLEAALAHAAASPVRVERADAADWVEARLAEPADAAATVLYHSIVWQYLPAATQARIIRALEQFGASCTAAAPLGWLRMEPATDHDSAELRLQTWPDGAARRLANADFHGRWIQWLD